MWTVVGGPYNSVFVGRRARRPIVVVVPPVVEEPTTGGGFLSAKALSGKERDERIRRKRIELGILPDVAKVIERVAEAQPIAAAEPEIDEAAIMRALQDQAIFAEAWKQEYAAYLETVRQAHLDERKKRLMRFMLLNA